MTNCQVHLRHCSVNPADRLLDYPRWDKARQTTQCQGSPRVYCIHQYTTTMTRWQSHVNKYMTSGAGICLYKCINSNICWVLMLANGFIFIPYDMLHMSIPPAHWYVVHSLLDEITIKSLYVRTIWISELKLSFIISLIVLSVLLSPLERPDTSTTTLNY